VKQVMVVTPQKIVEVARKYLNDDQATIVVVGDRKSIDEQLKPFGRLVGK
jgi:predicted Zn-dependent peptidase